MKSSLTLVPILDHAAVEQEKNLPPEAEAPSDRRPHLRLVSPEFQADLIKEAFSNKPKRKTRKRNAEKAGNVTTDAKDVVAKPAAKKPRKPYARKAKTEQLPAIDAEPVIALSDEKKAAIGDFLGLLSRVCDKQTADLYGMLQEVIQELGDDAPLVGTSDESVSFIDPELVADFEARVDAAIAKADQSEPVPSAVPVIEPQFTFNFIGELFVSDKNDPFKENEWTLFEEDFTSCWYDTKKEALLGLHQLMVDAGLNYACETKILTRVFALGDYHYKKYAFEAVVGLYSEHQQHDDKAVCGAQAEKIRTQLIPDSQDILQAISTKHKSESLSQIKPESQIVDKALKWLAIGCVASLAYAVLAMAVETGFF